MTPSEKTKLLRDVKELFTKNDELDERQSADIAELKKDIAALRKQFSLLEAKLDDKPKRKALHD